MAARKPPGRPKGVPNKLSGSVKENIICVFTRLGGTAAMARWAEDNPTEFYRIYSKLLPTDVTLGGGVDIRLSVTLTPTGKG